MDWRSCGPGNAVNPGCRMRRRRLSNSAWSRSRWGIPASGRTGSPPSSHARSGAGSASHPTACGGCCAATGSTPEPGAWAWSPAGQHPPNVSRDRRHRPATSRSPGPASWSRWTTYVGRLQGTKGAVWQYTAIDVGSAYRWAELRAGSVKHPQSRWTSALARRVAADLAARGWSLDAVLTDHGSEFAG